MGSQLREGERIAGERKLGVTLLADIEQIAVASVHWDPGGGIAPPLHLHARHAECFFVIEGELTFRLEEREVVAGAGTWVHVPPDVLHTFSVTGDSRAHFLDIHVPSCGFGDFVRGLYAAKTEDERRAARDAFDQYPVPEYSTGDPDLVIVRRSGGDSGVGSTEPPKSAGAGFAGTGAGAGEAIGDRSERRRATLLVDTDELTVTEFFYGPGERGAKPHIHHHHADAFLVLEGELTFSMLEPLRGPAGTFVVFPPNVVHGFDNDGSESALFYNFHMPASGFGEYLRGRNPDFDQHDPPADGGADPSSAVTVRL